MASFAGESPPCTFKILASGFFLSWFPKAMRFLQLCWLIRLLLVFSPLTVFKTRSVKGGRMARRKEGRISNISFVKSMSRVKQMKRSRKLHPLHLLLATCCWPVGVCWWTSLHPCRRRAALPLPCLVRAGWPRAGDRIEGTEIKGDRYGIKDTNPGDIRTH